MNRSARRCALAAVLALSAPALVASQPHASPDDAPTYETARAHFQRGVARLEASQWSEAVAELERARSLRSTPAVLYNLGLAYRALGRPREASEAFRAFGRTFDPTRAPEVAERVETYLHELGLQLGHLELRVEPAASHVFVDGSATPTRASLEVDPGRHLVSIEAEGFTSETRAVDVGPGERATLSLRLAPRPAPPREDAFDPARRALERSIIAPARAPERRGGVLASPWFWTTVVAVLVGAGVTAWALTRPHDAPLRGTLDTVTIFGSMRGAQ